MSLLVRSEHGARLGTIITALWFSDFSILKAACEMCPQWVWEPRNQCLYQLSRRFWKAVVQVVSIVLYNPFQDPSLSCTGSAGT